MKHDKIHQLKLHINFADEVLSGEKNFEVRENDRGFQKGDLVVFNVVDPDNMTLKHELGSWHKHTFEITYVLSGWGIKENYVVFGIKPWKKDKEE